MIKFFRKFRQKLLTENKFSKYMLYAIGEIVLVVIGILIALQINDWNTYQKDRIKEKYLLHGLVENLELNKKLIMFRIDLNDLLNKRADIILELHGKDFIFTDSLENTLRSAIVLPAIFSLPNQGFENIKSTGFDIIINKNLRSEIIQLFNVDYVETNIRFSKIGDSHLHQYQYMDENFKWVIKEGEAVLHPFHVEKTFKDNYFFSIISSKINSRYNLNYFLREDLDNTEKLLMLLQESGY